MDDIVSNADIRAQHAKRRLGAADARCRVCGESYAGCLEQHHIAGRANHDETHPLCRNCHRKASDLQRDHPHQIAVPPSFLEVVGHYLIGLADMLRLVAETLVQFGKSLIAQSERLMLVGAQ